MTHLIENWDLHELFVELNEFFGTEWLWQGLTLICLR